MGTNAEIRIAAAFVRDDQGRVLLVRKKDTKFFMQPGGKIENGESAADAVVREVREELGVDLDEIELAGEYSATAANEPDHVVTATIFLAAINSEPVPAAEIAEYVWYDNSKTTGIDIAPLSHQLLREFSA